jgi:hypothetical protein
MKLDIEADNVELVEISASKIRSYFTGDGEIETIETGLDLVQGMVFTQEHDSAYLVIKVTP